MFDKTIVKMGIVFSILTLLIGFWQWDRHQAYNGGYDKARVEMLEQFQDDLNAMMQAKDKELVIAVESRDKWKDKAIYLQSRPPTKVKVYVDRIIENNDCAVLTGFGELWNALRENYTY